MIGYESLKYDISSAPTKNPEYRLNSYSLSKQNYPTIKVLLLTKGSHQLHWQQIPSSINITKLLSAAAFSYVGNQEKDLNKNLLRRWTILYCMLYYVKSIHFLPLTRNIEIILWRMLIAFQYHLLLKVNSFTVTILNNWVFTKNSWKIWHFWKVSWIIY